MAHSMARSMALALTLALASPAAAWHEPQRAVTEYSASTLNESEWRVYLTLLIEYGITDDWEIGTMPILDLARVPNLVTKWTFARPGDFAFAVSGGVFTTNPNYFRDELPDIQVWFAPVGLYGTWRHPGGDLGLHASLQYVSVGTSGEGSVAEALDIDGAVSGSFLKLSPVLEWRRTRSFAWVVEGSILLAQRGDAAGRTTWRSGDGRTTVDLYGSASVADPDKTLANVSVSAYWSWDVFNLRLGLIYGHAEVPVVNLFVDQVLWLPEINLYWRF